MQRTFEHLSECVVMIVDGHLFRPLYDIIFIFTCTSLENSPIFVHEFTYIFFLYVLTPEGDIRRVPRNQVLRLVFC